MRLALLIIASLALVVVVASQNVVEESFATIKNTQGEQMVVFYHSTESSSYDVLKTIDKVARAVKREQPQFRFFKCDGDLPVNKAEFAEAQFSKGEFLFTSTPKEGIVKYSGPVTVKDIKAHILNKYLSFDPDDVAEFVDEDTFYETLDQSESAKPIFVKFYEQWCEHCKRLKETFQIAATHFKDRVQFMEIECSKNDDTTSFCATNEVKSYPALILFNGDDKIQYKEEMRTIGAFNAFFDKNVKDTKSSSTSNDDDDEPVVVKKPKKEAPAAAATPTPAAEAKKSKRDSSNDEESGTRGGGRVKRAAKKAAEAAAATAESADDDVLSLGKFSPPKDTAATLSIDDRVAALEAQVKSLSDKIDQLLKKR